MREVMEYELETKKRHLLKLQDYFRTDIKDIKSPKYEYGASLHIVFNDDKSFKMFSSWGE